MSRNYEFGVNWLNKKKKKIKKTTLQNSRRQINQIHKNPVKTEESGSNKATLSTHHGSHTLGNRHNVTVALRLKKDMNRSKIMQWKDF